MERFIGFSEGHQTMEGPAWEELWSPPYHATLKSPDDLNPFLSTKLENYADIPAHTHELRFRKRSLKYKVISELDEEMADI